MMTMITETTSTRKRKSYEIEHSSEDNSYNSSSPSNITVVEGKAIPHKKRKLEINVSNWNSLPQVILDMIVEFVPQHSTKYYHNISLVSKSMNKAIKKMIGRFIAWKSVFIDGSVCITTHFHTYKYHESIDNDNKDLRMVDDNSSTSSNTEDDDDHDDGDDNDDDNNNNNNNNNEKSKEVRNTNIENGSNVKEKIVRKDFYYIDLGPRPKPRDSRTFVHYTNFIETEKLTLNQDGCDSRNIVQLYDITAIYDNSRHKGPTGHIFNSQLIMEDRDFILKCSKLPHFNSVMEHCPKDLRSDIFVAANAINVGSLTWDAIDPALFENHTFIYMMCLLGKYWIYERIPSSIRTSREFLDGFVDNVVHGVLKSKGNAISPVYRMVLDNFDPKYIHGPILRPKLRNETEHRFSAQYCGIQKLISKLVYDIVVKYMASNPNESGSNSIVRTSISELEKNRNDAIYCMKLLLTEVPHLIEDIHPIMKSHPEIHNVIENLDGGNGLKFFMKKKEGFNTNKSLMLRAVMIDGANIKYASSALRKDKEIVCAAIRSYPTAIHEVINDEMFIRDIDVFVAYVESISTNNLFPTHCPLIMLFDIDSMIETSPEHMYRIRNAILKNTWLHNVLINHFVNTRKKYLFEDDIPSISFSVIDKYKQSDALESLARLVRGDKEFIKAAARHNDYILSEGICCDGIASDRDFIRDKIMPINPVAFMHTEKFRNDEEFFEMLISVKPHYIDMAPMSIRDNVFIFKNVVSKDGLLLRFASDNIRTNEIGIITTAIKNNPLAVMFCSEKCPKHYDLFQYAISLKPSIIADPNFPYKDNYTLYLQAVIADNMCLKYVPANIMYSKKYRIIETAIAASPLAIRYVDMNKYEAYNTTSAMELMLIAVQKDPSAVLLQREFFKKNVKLAEKMYFIDKSHLRYFTRATRIAVLKKLEKIN